jgi:hypothetical protein
VKLTAATKTHRPRHHRKASAPVEKPGFGAMLHRLAAPALAARPRAAVVEASRTVSRTELLLAAAALAAVVLASGSLLTLSAREQAQRRV